MQELIEVTQKNIEMKNMKFYDLKEWRISISSFL